MERGRAPAAQAGPVTPEAQYPALPCFDDGRAPSAEQHGPEGGGGEAGESGRQYSLTDTAVETRGGVGLTMSYGAPAETFGGEVVNTTSATVA